MSFSLLTRTCSTSLLIICETSRSQVDPRCPAPVELLPSITLLGPSRARGPHPCRPGTKRVARWIRACRVGRGQCRARGARLCACVGEDQSHTSYFFLSWPRRHGSGCRAGV